ncbi:uncharacterized protein LOC141597259 [Silene latifolia]|uniref:uncharacterized protein LOC141597259 n=1 Tax=Silene latifolia TaxID=37657 RepID=UPI003D7705EF
MATQTPLVIDDETMETLSVVTLPQVVAFKHSETGHFLAVVADGPLKDHLEFNADVDQLSQCVQFIVEMADNNMDVHLKSCYNNNYLSRESDEYKAFITATASQPVVDTGAWNCTLFRPFASAGSDGTKLYLYKLSVSAVGESEHENGARQYLRIAAPGGPQVHLLAVDCTTPVVTLPKYVSFKGDNGKFLQAFIEESGYRAYSVFKSDDCTDTRTVYEIVPVDNRIIRIKSYHFDAFLAKVHDDLIQGNFYPDTGDNALFEIVKRPENASTVIIRNMGNNMFCTRTPSNISKWPDYLIANGTDGDAKEAHIEVVEPVVSREINPSPTDYRMAEAVLYDRESLDMDHKIVTNTFTVPAQWQMKFTFTKSRTSSWDNMETIKWDGSSILRTHVPQIIGDNEVVLRDTYSGPCTWGQPIDRFVTFIIHHEVVVPPKTSIYATLVAKKSTCKVPFSFFLSSNRRTYNGNIQII